MATKSGGHQPSKPEPVKAGTELYPLTWQIIAASTLVMGAGALHFVYAPIHLGAARGQGIFFLLLGFLQIGWGATALRHPSPRTYLVGMTVATVMPAVLYAVTRFVAAPFGEEAEGVDIIGASTFLGEFLGAVALAWHGLRQEVQWQSPDVRPAALVVVLVGAGVVVAGGLFGLGLAADATISWFGEPEGGGSASGHHVTLNPESPLDPASPLAQVGRAHG